ncbi:hypothetical protein QWY82_05855 [Simiduia curdlanivorans]|uniref:Uncharacterized protein n=1 Tax=Simiduia curdlanivorans TaxID=1492769 RepID=A0ABV8V374_9GAMM|nr:hypothetical protein [Simiduia curdlanivorans]MDN3638336.1 hypothetical protein [Simiduia curdlanivorans]
MNKYPALCIKYLMAFALLCMSANPNAGEASQQLEASYWFHQDSAQDLTPAPDNSYAPFTLTKDAKGYQIRLLKKLADWSHQHTNGLTFKVEPNAFNQQHSALQISFFINAELTETPTNSQLKIWYQEKFAPLNLADFDDDQAHLLMTFWTQRDANQGRWRNDYLLSIAPSKWGKPLSFELPLASFICSYELNYQRTIASDQTACPTKSWQELTLVNETRNQNVLRNLNSVAFENQAIAEHYRALQLSQLQLSIISSQAKD